MEAIEPSAPPTSQTYSIRSITICQHEHKKRLHLITAEDDDDEVFVITKEFSEVVLRCSPHYIRRKLNESPLNELPKWTVKDNVQILKLIGKIEPLTKTPNSINL